MSKPSFVDSIVGWLREGYPQGVPPQDYVPLLALLRRRLTDDEVEAVVAMLVASGEVPVDSADIGTSITKVTDALPSSPANVNVLLPPVTTYPLVVNCRPPAFTPAPSVTVPDVPAKIPNPDSQT